MAMATKVIINVRKSNFVYKNTWLSAGLTLDLTLDSYVWYFRYLKHLILIFVTVKLGPSIPDFESKSKGTSRLS